MPIYLHCKTKQRTLVLTPQYVTAPVWWGDLMDFRSRHAIRRMTSINSRETTTVMAATGSKKPK